MKKLFGMVFVLIAMNCSAQGLPAQQQEIQDYVATNRPLVDSGQLLWSAYYAGLQVRLTSAGAPGDMLTRIGSLVRYANQFELGEIDAATFKSKRQMIQAEQANADEARRIERLAQQRADQIPSAPDNSSARSAQIMALAATLLQIGSPRVLAPPAPADFDWDWDEFYGSNGQLVWACRGIQSAQFADQSHCAYKPRVDFRWPGK